MPTVPIVAPRIADLDDEREYNRINMLILRNTALGNFFDRCAISIPCHRRGDAPVGLMLMGETMGDARLFRSPLGWKERWRGECCGFKRNHGVGRYAAFTEDTRRATERMGHGLWPIRS